MIIFLTGSSNDNFKNLNEEDYQYQVSSTFIDDTYDSVSNKFLDKITGETYLRPISTSSKILEWKGKQLRIKYLLGIMLDVNDDDIDEKYIFDNMIQLNENVKYYSNASTNLSPFVENKNVSLIDSMEYILI